MFQEMTARQEGARIGTDARKEGIERVYEW